MAASTAGYDDDMILTRLPLEIMDSILAYLEPRDLDRLAVTCRAFYELATSDELWKPFIEENTPGAYIASPHPFSRWRDLWHAHDPHWFLPRNVLWFGDQPLCGQLVVVRLDQLSGTIIGCPVVVERSQRRQLAWQRELSLAENGLAETHHITISKWTPIVQVHTDHENVKLETPVERDTFGNCQPLSSGFSAQTYMPTKTLPCMLQLAKTFRGSSTRNSTWPPDTIPADEYVETGGPESLSGPSSRVEVCQTVFQSVRTFPPPLPGVISDAFTFSTITTFGTLNKQLYTPTWDRPFRGIWVGDYSSHGCEFLLLQQPDQRGPQPIQLSLETTESYEARLKEWQIWSGELRAIKLTGDPNVPRGEYSWLVPDIGPDACLGRGGDKDFEFFAGPVSRVQRGYGQIADEHFLNRKLTPKLVPTGAVGSTSRLLACRPWRTD
jgi:hypothetical protein